MPRYDSLGVPSGGMDADAIRQRLAAAQRPGQPSRRTSQNSHGLTMSQRVAALQIGAASRYEGSHVGVRTSTS